jgi:glutamine amidotransferase
MTRLFGCICNQPERLALALEPVRHVLVAEAPVSRWGLGYIQSDEVLLTRTPRRSPTDVDFFETLQRIDSDHVIGHAAEDDGLSGNDNTQPFRYRRWLFAQDGTRADMSQVYSRIADLIPEFLRRNLKGKTPAELMFYTFLAGLHEKNAIDDVNLSLAVSRTALASTLERIEAVLAEAGIAAPPGNLITSNGRWLMAARLDQPLYLRRLMVPMSDRRGARSHTTFKGVLVVSTDRDPGEGFEEIPSRSALLLSREVRADVVPITV